MSLYIRKFGETEINMDLKYCKVLLRRLEHQISDVKLVIYKDYPNISQGKIINELEEPMSKDFKVKDIVKNLFELPTYIFEFKL